MPLPAGLAPEKFFEALDGRVVSVGRSRWTLEIFSILDDERGRRWVQLAARGQPDYPLMLQAKPTTPVNTAILAIVRWLYDPEPPNGRPLVVN
jgi:hypothetical protein